MSKWDMKGATGEWFTPPSIFEALDCRFDLDVASPIYFQDCFVPADKKLICGALQKPWEGYIWMNPPFGGRNGIVPWLNKFVEHGDGIALMPDRTSVPWFVDVSKKVDLILFLSPKVKFIREDGSLGVSPSTGTALMSMGEKGRKALLNAYRMGAGTLVRPMEAIFGEEV